MTDVLPLKGKNFCGSLEVQGQLTAASKVLRIQRMKEVFEQEKMLSAVAAEAHRQCLAERKAARMRIEKDRKRTEKERELRALSNKRDNAVRETGSAHERAKKNVDIMLKRSEIESNTAARRHEEVLQRGNAALKLRHEQILETQRASMRLLELQQTKREIRMSDREDAHANGEVYSARQQLLTMQKEAIANLHSVPVVYTQTRVQQGAVSIEQRFPVEVHAQVWRHGVNGAANGAAGANSRFLAEVRNAASLEEITIRKKNWSKVMTEMLTKIKVKLRAQVAKCTVQQRKGVIYLESELQRLEAADKAPARQNRVCSTLGVAPDAEPPRIQSAFEKMFLSKPVRLDNKHIQYRTGSHLVQANLEKHVQHQQDVDASGGAFPTWHSELPDFASSAPSDPLPQHFHVSHEGFVEADVHSTGGSSAVSDELRVLQCGRMYEELDGCSTVSDIPTISRPPPHWTSCPNPLQQQYLDDEGKQNLEELSAVRTHHQQQRTSHNVDVKIPQVQVRSASSGMTQHQQVNQKGLSSSHAPSSSPSSPSSVATSPSTATSSSSSFSQAVSMKSSVDSESSSSWAAASVLPPPPAPLSLRIEVVKGTSDLSVGAAEAAVTPPRHQSTRGSTAGGGGHHRPIDPFTPPEVSMGSRSNHQRVARQQQQSADYLLHPSVETGSPQSGVSSTNTEQARHDRLPCFDAAPPGPVGQQVLNDSTVSADSYISPPSAPTRGGVLPSPLWTEEDSAEVDLSRNDVNVSALTELLFDDGSSTTSTVSELLRAQKVLSSSTSTTSSSNENSQSRFKRTEEKSVSSVASGNRDSNVGTRSNGSGDVGMYSSSSLASRSSLGSSDSSSASSASSSSSGSSGSSVASSASSSSASMLSYLDSAKKPDRPATTLLPGVTITIAGNSSGQVPSHSLAPASPAVPAPPARGFSPSQSLESDSVSMLSITSDHPQEAYRRDGTYEGGRGNAMLDSFAALTRQELQDVLDDLSDVDGDMTNSPLQHTHAQNPPPESVDRSHSTRSSSREVSPDAQDYASMFGSDDDDHEEVGKSNGKFGVAGALRSFPLPLTIDRIEEEEESIGGGVDQDSVRSASTGELFDRWQQLYQGSLQLGSQARVLRSEHVSAYNASSSIALSEGESFVSREESSPPRRATSALMTATGAPVPASPLNVLVFPQQQQDGIEFSKSSLYESDLRSSRSGSGSGGPSTRSPSPTGSDNDSRSSDSLSPRKRTSKSSGSTAAPEVSIEHALRQDPAFTTTRVTTTISSTTTASRTTSVDMRASYEHNTRATALMSELDKLSLDWQQKQAFYANPSSSKTPSTSGSAPEQASAPASAAATGATPPRAQNSSHAAVPQPTQPPHYASPSWLTRKPTGSADAGNNINNGGAGVISTSLSSLSAVNSPPEETCSAITATATGAAGTAGAVNNSTPPARDVYTGRLLVHSGQRAAYPVTAAHLPDLAARLELEDSMNSSLLSSEIGAEDALGRAAGGNARNTVLSTYATHSTYSAYSSEGEDDESESRSLAELLNSQAGSATRGRIQSEIAAMRSRLLASVGGPQSRDASPQRNSSAIVPTSRGEQHHSSSYDAQVSNAHHPGKAATTIPAVAASTSTGRYQRGGGVSEVATTNHWSSSGEDTYSSSRYYSAGSAKVGSGASGSGSSSMRTADTSSVDATTTHYPLATDAVLRSTSRVSATTSTQQSSATHSSYYASSSTSRFVSHTMQQSVVDSSSAAAVMSTSGLRDDSGRPGTYTFTRKHSPSRMDPATGNSSSPVDMNTSSASSSGAAAESFLLGQQQLNSPGGTASVSRLSEYAMLSQHTLHTSRGSPDSDVNSPTQWRQRSQLHSAAVKANTAGEREGLEDESYEFTRHANTSAGSDSSTFSEYMRHFPSTGNK